MSISRVMVGLPIDRPNGRTRGGLKWSGQTRSTKDRSGGVRLAKPVSAKPKLAPPPAAATLVTPNRAAAPLSFLSARHFLVLAALVLAGVMLVWGLVRSNHTAVAHSYEISDLTQQKLRLLETNRQLNTELARVSSLHQLEELARGKLGLITPKQGQIVVID